MDNSFTLILSNLRRSRLLGTALFGLAIFHLAMQLIVVMPRNLAVTNPEENIAVYYKAAVNAHNRRPIYRKQPNYGPDHEIEAVYLYAPPFAAIISPFAALSFVRFVQLWYCVMFAASWVFAWCLARLYFDDRIDIRKVLIWGLILDLFPGGYAAFSIGQIEPLLWALFGLGVVAIARPTLWALCTFVKPFYMWPLFAEIADAARENGIKVLLRSFFPAIIIAAALILCGGIICGWNSYVVWVRDVLPTLSQGNFNSSNVSFSMAALRAARFIGWQYSGGPLPTLPHLWLTAASIGAPLLTWFLLRRYSIQLKSAALVIVAILFAPVCWTYYLPLALPLIALVFREKQAKSTFNVPTQYQLGE
jgi:hypothetical protein